VTIGREQSAGGSGKKGDRAVVWFGHDGTAMERAGKAVKMLQVLARGSTLV
jgi:hypothetical protein